jgi:hypothetical protein
MPVQLGDRPRHHTCEGSIEALAASLLVFRTEDDFRSGLIVGRNGAGSYSIAAISR